MKDKIAHGSTQIKRINKSNYRVHGEHGETLRMDFLLLAFLVLRNGLKNEVKNMRQYLSLILLLLILVGCSINRNSSYLVTPKPILVKTVPPIYPESLNDKDIIGEVLVKIEVLADGSVKTAEVTKSLDSDFREFDEAAINAVKQWKFASIAGNYEESFSYKVIIPVRFNSEQIPPNIEGMEKIPVFNALPKVLKSVPPLYPKKFQQYGIEGEVILIVEVLSDGSVGKIIIEKSLLTGEGGLDECAINAVKQWKFSPALDEEGKPVLSMATFPIIFKLN